MKLVSKAKHKHIVVIPQDKCKISEKFAWCKNNFGPNGSRRTKEARWRFGWGPTTSSFHFRNKKDAVWFLMMWGGA